MNSLSTRLLSLLVLISPAGCGLGDIAGLIQGTGTSGKTVEQDTDTELLTVRGSISSQGSGSQLQGWSVLAMPNDGSGGRWAEIDNAGLFSLQNFDRQKYWTFTIFSPDTITQSVLSIPNSLPHTIAQYVKMRGNTLPHLFLQGSIVKFSSLNGLVVGREIASDLDDDGVPDGMVNISQNSSGQGLARIGTSQSLALTSDMDSDLDGIPNELDTDIDGDGVINVLDADDDGDAILDVFDIDADGNLIADSADPQFDLFRNDQHVYKVGVEYRTSDRTDPGFALVDISGGLRISAETNRSVGRVSVIGAPAFLNGAMVRDDMGNFYAWDRSLLDDGMNDDGLAHDGIFSRVIYLCCDKKPLSNLALIIHAENTTGRVLGDYPVVFSNVTTNNSTILFEPVTRTVQLSGNPFADIADFQWLIQVYDENGYVEYSSAVNPGTARTLIVPENVVLEDRQIIAESFSLPKTFGRAMYRVPTVSLTP